MLDFQKPVEKLHLSRKERSKECPNTWKLYVQKQFSENLTHIAPNRVIERKQDYGSKD